MHIDEADSGMACLELVQKKKYDIIFLDHMMPEMDGIEATHNIRNLESECYKRLPIIALTANAVNGIKQKFLEAGLDDFLSKPIEMVNMLRILKRWLPEEKICKKETKNEVGKVGSANLKQSETVVQEQKNLETIEQSSWDLPEIEGIDMDMAVKYSGNMSMFLQLVQVFCHTLEQKAMLIEDYEAKEDIKNYVIEVHALKSSSKLLGAMHLSKLAEHLEMAGKEDNLLEIHTKTAELLEEYRSFKSRLNPFIKDEKIEKKKIGKNELKELLEEMLPAVEAFDLDRTEELMTEIEQYEFNDEFECMCEKLKKAVEDFAYDQGVELINSFVQTLS